MRNSEDIGKLILRLSVGVLLLLHGIAKMKSGGLAGIEGMLGNANLPGFMAWGVYVGEAVAPILLILGILVRPAALVIVFNMIVAVGLAHSGDILKLSKSGAWAIELPALFTLGALAVFFLGAGRFRVQRKASEG
ncbi:MAG: DoxX family protein [Kiritimatiellae bacterium]|nr:DoxX family protein [Kiritimatiellia bacterium]MCO6400895.1 DoxX family protein [Verrucomicrobiota bacterium]